MSTAAVAAQGAEGLSAVGRGAGLLLTQEFRGEDLCKGTQTCSPHQPAACS